MTSPVREPLWDSYAEDAPKRAPLQPVPVLSIAPPVQQRERLLSCLLMSSARPRDERFYSIWSLAEQSPNPDSRIALIDKRDALGMPRVKLNWRLSELDTYSVLRTLELFAQELGRSDLGRLRIGTFPETFHYGNHHMGTTRMSDDPRQGVVDAHCCVHGMTNLYVAGSSVFATSGASTPTLTIVALALRLAKHVKESMRS